LQKKNTNQGVPPRKRRAVVRLRAVGATSASSPKKNDLLNYAGQRKGEKRKAMAPKSQKRIRLARGAEILQGGVDTAMPHGDVRHHQEEGAGKKDGGTTKCGRNGSKKRGLAGANQRPQGRCRRCSMSWKGQKRGVRGREGVWNRRTNTN